MCYICCTLSLVTIFPTHIAASNFTRLYENPTRELFFSLPSSEFSTLFRCFVEYWFCSTLERWNFKTSSNIYAYTRLPHTSFISLFQARQLWINIGIFRAGEIFFWLGVEESKNENKIFCRGKAITLNRKLRRIFANWRRRCVCWGAKRKKYFFSVQISALLCVLLATAPWVCALRSNHIYEKNSIEQNRWV